MRFVAWALRISYTQSQYIEVVQGDIFMEQKMRFGLVLGWFWAGFGLVGNTEKKLGANHEQLLRGFFHVLMSNWLCLKKH